MAGHRRGSGRATQGERRWLRRREFLAVRLAAATSPAGRVAAAAEYARGALGDLPPVVADRAATELVRLLVDVVDQARGEETRS